MTSFSLGGAQHNIFPAKRTLRPAHKSPRGEARMHFSAGLEHCAVSRAADAQRPAIQIPVCWQGSQSAID